jgi:hypothetical protein
MLSVSHFQKQQEDLIMMSASTQEAQITQNLKTILIQDDTSLLWVGFHFRLLSCLSTRKHLNLST